MFLEWSVFHEVKCWAEREQIHSPIQYGNVWRGTVPRYIHLTCWFWARRIRAKVFWKNKINLQARDFFQTRTIGTCGTLSSIRKSLVWNMLITMPENPGTHRSTSFSWKHSKHKNARFDSEEERFDWHPAWADRDCPEFGQRFQIQDWVYRNQRTFYFSRSKLQIQNGPLQYGASDRMGSWFLFYSKRGLRRRKYMYCRDLGTLSTKKRFSPNIYLRCLKLDCNS